MWKGAVFSFSVPHVVLLAVYCPLLWSIIHVSSTHTLEEESHPCRNWCTADFPKLSSILGIVGTVRQSAVICWNSLNMAQFFDPDSTTCFFFYNYLQVLWCACLLQMQTKHVFVCCYRAIIWFRWLKDHVPFKRAYAVLQDGIQHYLQN